MLVTQSRPTVPGILQVRILEWVAIFFSRDLPDTGLESRSPTLQANSLPSEPPGKLNSVLLVLYVLQIKIQILKTLTSRGICVCH